MARTKGPSSDGVKGRDYATSVGSRNGSHPTFLDWDAQKLQETIELITLDGDCVMFSRTTDGGALHVRILSNGVVHKFYAAHGDELLQLVDGLEAACKA